MSQSRQLAAIMFTDIVGYTALMGEDEQKAFELLKKNRLVQRPIIEEHNGRWLKEIGDGVLASFNTVSEAVYCAGAIQKACENEPDLKLRIGIHEGEVVFDGDDVFGDGVNIAARLEPLAPIGGILVSEAVHKNVLNKKGITTILVGEKELKGVREPVRVYQVQVEGVEIPEPKTSPSVASSNQVEHASKKPSNQRKVILGAVAIILVVLGYIFYANTNGTENASETEIVEKSIAVLPFESLSGDPEKQYEADAVMDAIIMHLSKIENLRVISRRSVLRYRNTTLTIPEIAAELNVHHLLEGSFQKHGDKANLIVQLINAQHEEDHLWANEYNRDWSDIFAVQSEVAQTIARELQAVITPEEKQRIERAPTTDIAAYNFYIRGNQERLNYNSTNSPKHMKAAHQLFDAALNIDPDYLMAIVGKGETLVKENKPDSALFYADRAIDLDPKFNKGYGLKGESYMRLGNSDLAIEFFLKAISLPPKDEFWLWYHLALGQVYIFRKNDVIKGLPYLKKSLEVSIEFLDIHLINIAIHYTTIGDYQRAEEFLQKAIEIESRDYCWAIYWYSKVKLVQGNFQESYQFNSLNCSNLECPQCLVQLFESSLLQSEFEQAEQYYKQWQTTSSPDPWLDNQYNYQIGYVYHHLGRIEEADKIFIEQIQKLESELENGQRLFYGSLPNYLLLHLSRIHAFQGNKNEAIKYLTEYAKKGFDGGWHDFILIDPFFESLWDNPQFKAIVKQAQEEKAALRAQVREMEERGELTL